MSFFNKLNTFFYKLKKIFLSFFLKKKTIKFILFFLGIIIFIFILIFNLKREIYQFKKNNFKWKNLKSDLKYNINYVKYKLNNIKENQVDDENRFIVIKSMFLGIIACVIFFSWKKGINFGIIFGTFCGACIGVWLCLLVPHFIYFLELIIINIFKISM
ncbi:hypothetical protein AXA84_0222 [Candidatus Phytoplasma oryzae]|uniref:Uncharacterized protein n=1 Tax=Candidatus Phytoplasma oryzae TaxID=203274 RepID=A0A139JQM8_9MOLU|nr:hypothetical protein [Candidatus Phytoplasma oryzae]KXT29275.1 hypothetical protein AXA84_0222 [Candidatus Phytoplasma oryzae]RAM57858.1 hypothetical protein DH96_00840 [Candidatus Phytoplasma oryzae]